jgi:hypothetical protein
MSVFTELAEYFEKAAEEEETKAAALATAPIPAVTKKEDAPDPIKEAAVAFREATGTDIDTELAGKIASDPAAFEALRKMAEVNRRPERLGNASDRHGQRPVPKTATERTQQAYDNFGRFLSTGERSNS